MRLTWKLAVLVAIGVGTQLLIDRHADDIDEAGFAFRVFLAHLHGQTAADPELMDMAVDLHCRKWDRAGYAANYRRERAPVLDEDGEPGMSPVVRVNASGAAN